MTTEEAEHAAPGQARRGRSARQAARLARAMETVPFLTRKLPPVEVLSVEGLEAIEHNADTLLQEVGIEIVNFPEALGIFAAAGADVQGSRVRFERGMCRQIVQASAPKVFTQRARNPKRDVVIGDPHMVLVPTYGSPFVHDIDRGRRYATIEDFRNFVKLTYTSHTLHHGGGTLCEPVDLPVNKRHLEMVYSHIRFSDRAFMGSVTHPSRAADSVEMARIVFGADTLEREHVIMGLANANSPMSWDFNMLGSAKAYAEANQIMLITPFILGGAMAPVTVAAQATQTLAEALAGMAFCQMVRPGAPVIFGSFASSMSMQTGAPTFGTPEPQLVLFVLAALARRLGVPFRSGGNFTASKVPDYQAAYESAVSFMPRAGSRAAWRSATRSSCSTRTRRRWRRPISAAWTRPTTATPSMRCSVAAPGSTSSARHTRWRTSRTRSGAPSCPITTASSSGSSMGRSTPRNGRTCAGSAASRSTRCRRSTRASTKS
jgi:trimethylamine---corrinoid protein Co-methyltransferase